MVYGVAFHDKGIQKGKAMFHQDSKPSMCAVILKIVNIRKKTHKLKTKS